MLAWFLIPGTGLDRWAFTTLASTVSENPITVEGKGSHASPWELQTTSPSEIPAELPASIGLKDNLDDIFQSSPHSPIDMAVIFNNLRRLGTQKLACSVLLSWDDPDAISLAAMESAMEEFDSVVLAAPVTRGAITETMPPDFRRASVSVDSIAGDTSSLPVINRVSVPTLIRGGDNSLAGFSIIDSQPSAEAIHLVARWDERVVFAFPVVAAAQHLGIAMEDLQVEIGSHIQFGDGGPKVAVDEFGRLGVDFDQEVQPDLLAEDLIDAELGNLELPSFASALLCDFRSHADITTRDFNRVMVPSVQMMITGEGEARQSEFARLSSHWELLFLLLVALSWSLGKNRNWIILIVQLIGFSLAQWYGMRDGIWLPGIAVVITVIIGWLCSTVLGQGRKRTTSMPRLDRLEFESAPTEAAVSSSAPEAPDKPAEEEDYALAPKSADIDSKHESD